MAQERDRSLLYAPHFYTSGIVATTGESGARKDYPATGTHLSQRGLQPGEGLEETPTVYRLGVGRLLRQTLASTNPIESCFSILKKLARNVKRWRAGDHALRWTATRLLEAEKQFHKVKGYRELEILQRKTDPVVDSTGTGGVTCGNSRAVAFKKSRDNFIASITSVQSGSR